LKKKKLLSNILTHFGRQVTTLRAITLVSKPLNPTAFRVLFPIDDNGNSVAIGGKRSPDHRKRHRSLDRPHRTFFLHHHRRRRCSLHHRRPCFLLCHRRSSYISHLVRFLSFLNSTLTFSKFSPFH